MKIKSIDYLKQSHIDQNVYALTLELDKGLELNTQFRLTLSSNTVHLDDEELLETHDIDCGELVDGLEDRSLWV